MKKRHLIFGGAYGIALVVVLTFSSCDDGPITPNDPNGNGVDTTWTDPNDSTFYDPGGNGTPNDSTYNDPNPGGGGTPCDSTYNDTLGGGN